MSSRVALPKVKDDLGLSQVGAGLILTAAQLLFGALILAGGALGDVFGRKRVLLLGVIVGGAFKPSKNGGFVEVEAGTSRLRFRGAGSGWTARLAAAGA